MPRFLHTFFLTQALITQPLFGGSQPYHLSFEFQQKGGGSPHLFVLKWPNADGNLQEIEVLNSKNRERLQLIKIDQQKVHLIWRDLASNPKQLRDKILEFTDYNFDKYGDLRLTQSWPYLAGDKHYLIWLFEPKKKQYVLSDELTALSAPVSDEKKQRIYSTTFGQFGGSEYVTSVYSINSAGHPTLTETITQKIDDPSRLTFTRLVERPEGGETRTICKISIPAEGKTRILQGDQKICEPYARKGAPHFYQTK